LSDLLSLRKQNTIGGEASVSGFGYFSNRDVTVTFRPAEPDAGIQFIRTDLDSPLYIPAKVEHRIESPRRTVLTLGGQNVEMVEHIMSALTGLRIDNCEVHVDGSEMPGCDGSSLPFVVALQEAGIQEQDAYRQRLVVTEKTRVNDEDGWIEARPLSSKAKPSMQLHYRLDYGINHIIGRQSFRCELETEHYIEEIAPARTYLLKEEADWMRSQGLGLRTTYQDLLVFEDPDGVIDNELRFEDECVRHKMLDMIGDLALSGFDLVGEFVGYRSGHRLNAMLTKALLAEGKVVDAPSAIA